MQDLVEKRTFNGSTCQSSTIDWQLVRRQVGGRELSRVRMCASIRSENCLTLFGFERVTEVSRNEEAEQKTRVMKNKEGATEVNEAESPRRRINTEGNLQRTTD